MRKPALTFRCASRSERNDYHSISVEDGKVLCSCTGTDWCSHIDATLVAGEREMVPFEEWDIADQAQRFLAGSLSAPGYWKAHWREDKVWRGITAPRQTHVERAIYNGKPTICFIGEGQLGNRHDYVEEAADLGWQVIDTPSALVTLVVCSPRRLSSQKAQLARTLDLPMLAFSDWEESAFDITEQVLEAIERCREAAADQQKQAA